jgi:hypothetical protein
MPAPSGSEIASMAKGAVQSAGLKGENAPDMAEAIGETMGTALQLFMAKAMVMPGIPAAAPPPPGSGATAGPGMLAPPPVGGPMAADIEPIASGQLTAKGIKGENAGDLAKVIAGTIAQGINLFTATVMVAPGIAIAGFTSSAPGSLMGAAPPAAALEAFANGLCAGNNLRGENAGDLAKALGDTVNKALTQLMSRAKVMPAIAASPGATAAPGRLM